MPRKIAEKCIIIGILIVHYISTVENGNKWNVAMEMKRSEKTEMEKYEIERMNGFRTIQLHNDTNCCVSRVYARVWVIRMSVVYKLCTLKRISVSNTFASSKNEEDINESNRKVWVHTSFQIQCWLACGLIFYLLPDKTSKGVFFRLLATSLHRIMTSK